ncbi:(d)CMP kinase [Oceanibacterium hippocampi]|uniref:Cytidylate kinase n=1 Tax=Oceanibacterium hippocampi TaxID=745714 RepID=A0A1Y5RR21_9PROT|nr:(d)CMP kinase [Oceanibacterium hippocampi]SLN22469.1 Cytidylate kinase [Oceanibacterium hippocampi]
MIIAVDGPVAAGKGTLARGLARHFGLRHLDTGALYRAVALALLRAGTDPTDESAAVAAAAALEDPDLDDAALRHEKTGQAASIVAAMPGVRAALIDFQRRFAAKPPGAVLDGRDIGTVICPDADAKLFVTASIEARARRRHEELQARGLPGTLEQVAADLAERDRRDAGRAAAPLRQAPDAYLLDTTKLDIESAESEAIAVVSRKLARVGSGSGS